MSRDCNWLNDVLLGADWLACGLFRTPNVLVTVVLGRGIAVVCSTNHGRAGKPFITESTQECIRGACSRGAGFGSIWEHLEKRSIATCFLVYTITVSECFVILCYVFYLYFKCDYSSVVNRYRKENCN